MGEVERVLECMPHMVVRCDERGQIIYANNKWKRSCGKRGEEGEEGWMAVVHPGDKEETRKKWKQHVEYDTPFEVTHRLCNHAGDYKYAIF